MKQEELKKALEQGRRFTCDKYVCFYEESKIYNGGSPFRFKDGLDCDYTMKNSWNWDWQEILIPKTRPMTIFEAMLKATQRGIAVKFSKKGSWHINPYLDEGEMNELIEYGSWREVTKKGYGETHKFEVEI